MSVLKQGHVFCCSIIWFVIWSRHCLLMHNTCDALVTGPTKQRHLSHCSSMPVRGVESNLASATSTLSPLNVHKTRFSLLLLSRTPEKKSKKQCPVNNIANLNHVHTRYYDPGTNQRVVNLNTSQGDILKRWLKRFHRVFRPCTLLCNTYPQQKHEWMLQQKGMTDGELHFNQWNVFWNKTNSFWGNFIAYHVSRPIYYTYVYRYMHISLLMIKNNWPAQYFSWPWQKESKPSLRAPLSCYAAGNHY